MQSPPIPFMALPALIEAQGRRIPHLQKVADAADFADPGLELVLRHGLRVEPRLHPRQWEFAMAYLALLQAGALRADSHGISFGSGREPLIFPLAAVSAHLTVTDLYSDDTAWTVARTADPLAFVLEAAPADFDRSRLAVAAMDMRHISFPDASFDYAYSISAFEHIGEDADFIRHLQEVRRVLRPGGAYVLTTELCFGPETHATIGNYAFALNHLLALFAQAGLHPEPLFDARLSRRNDNQARHLSETRQRDASHTMTELLVVREFSGVMSGPALFVLRAVPTPAPVQVIGLKDSIAWLQAAYTRRLALQHSDWSSVNPFALMAQSRSPFCSLWGSEAGEAQAGGVVFGSTYLGLGDRPMEVQVSLVADAAMAKAAQLSLRVYSVPAPGKGSLVMEHAEVVNLDPAGPMATARRLRFTPQRDRSYCIFGLHQAGPLMLSDVSIWLRHAPVA